MLVLDKHYVDLGTTPTHEYQIDHCRHSLLYLAPNFLLYTNLGSPPPLFPFPESTDESTERSATTPSVCFRSLLYFLSIWLSDTVHLLETVFVLGYSTFVIHVCSFLNFLNDTLPTMPRHISRDQLIALWETPCWCKNMYFMCQTLVGFAFVIG